MAAGAFLGMVAGTASGLAFGIWLITHEDEPWAVPVARIPNPNMLPEAFEPLRQFLDENGIRWYASGGPRAMLWVNESDADRVDRLLTGEFPSLELIANDRGLHALKAQPPLRRLQSPQTGPME